MTRRWTSLGLAVLVGGCAAEVAPPPAGFLLSFSPMVPTAKQVRVSVYDGGAVLVDAVAVPEAARDQAIEPDEAFLITFDDRWVGSEVRVTASVVDGQDVRGFGEITASPVSGQIVPTIIAVREAFCGDGVVRGGESCDPADPSSADGCGSDCQPATDPDTCGDHRLDLGEACDPAMFAGHATCMEAGFLPGAENRSPTCSDRCTRSSCGPPIDNPVAIMQAFKRATEGSTAGAPVVLRIFSSARPYDFTGVAEVLVLGGDHISVMPLNGPVLLSNVALRIAGHDNSVERLQIQPPRFRAQHGFPSALNGFQRRYGAIEVVGSGHQIRSNAIMFDGGAPYGVGIFSEATSTRISANYIRCEGPQRETGIISHGAGVTIDQNVVLGSCAGGIQVRQAEATTSSALTRVDHNSVRLSGRGLGVYLEGPGLCLRYNIVEVGHDLKPDEGPRGIAVTVRDISPPDGGCNVDGTGGVPAVAVNLMLGFLRCEDRDGNETTCAVTCSDGFNAHCQILDTSPFVMGDSLCVAAASAPVDRALDLGYDLMGMVPAATCRACFAGMKPDVGAREVGSSRTYAQNVELSCGSGG